MWSDIIVFQAFICQPPALSVNSISADEHSPDIEELIGYLCGDDSDIMLVFLPPKVLAINIREDVGLFPIDAHEPGIPRSYFGDSALQLPW